jgi:hypothetical protein
MNRLLSILCCCCCLLCTPALASEPAVEYTFLKSLPGQREAMKQFIVANWFAMDDVAIARGQIQGYQLLDDESGEGWDVVVAVTYHDARGYEGVAAEFEKIRQAHRTVLVEGKSLRELGRIVGSRKLLLRAQGGAPAR